MNQVSSFIGGWAAFAGCTLGGAYLGYQVFAEQHVINLAQNEVLKVERRKQLEGVQERWRKEREEARERGGAGGGGLGGGLAGVMTKRPERPEKKKVEQVLLSSHANRVGGQADVREFGD